MAISPEAVALIKQFEPVMLFHPNETFFPIDPTFYLDRCALWRAKPHVRNFNPGGGTADKEDWGEPPAGFNRKPQIAKGGLAALQKEVVGGKKWIGEVEVGQSPFLVIPEPMTERPLSEDRFLQLTGWEPFIGAPNEVTATSTNRQPTLGPSTYNSVLQGGRSWYFGEYFTNQQLLSQFGSQTPNGLDIFRAVINNARLNAPRLLVYHFFYALHDESLRGCDAAGGQTFATFAGEWTSVAILIDSTATPLFIGLTSRNVGDPSSISGGENRVGMTIHPWKQVDAIGAHPKIFVSLGTHGNYLSPGPHPLTPFTPGDIDLSQGTCGEIEDLDDVISTGPTGEAIGEDAISHDVVYVVGAINLIIGLLLAWIDTITAGTQTITYAVDPDRKPQDETGGGSLGFGLILRPPELFVPEQAAAQRLEDWATKMPGDADNPRFDFVVDRDTQLWWAPRGKSRGYAGRWGPRVTNDPKERRSGMRCPPFALMALEGVARL